MLARIIRLRTWDALLAGVLHLHPLQAATVCCNRLAFQKTRLKMVLETLIRDFFFFGSQLLLVMFIQWNRCKIFLSQISRLLCDQDRRISSARHGDGPWRLSSSSNSSNGPVCQWPSRPIDRWLCGKPLVGTGISDPALLRAGSCSLAPWLGSDRCLRPVPSSRTRTPREIHLSRRPPPGTPARPREPCPREGLGSGLLADASPPGPRRRVRPSRGRGGGGGEELHQQVPAARGQRWHARLPPPVSTARFSLPPSPPRYTIRSRFGVAAGSLGAWSDRMVPEGSRGGVATDEINELFGC